MDSVVELLAALEASPPELSVPALGRALGGCRTPACRAVLGDPPEVPTSPPAGLSPAQWQLLGQLLAHDPGAPQRGAVLAPDGSSLTLAPLLAGIEVGLKRAGGWHHPSLEPALDPLFAVTIAEALGTSFLLAHDGGGGGGGGGGIPTLGPDGCWDDIDDPQNYTLEGPPSPIPDAVANGAMDGVLLGARLAEGALPLAELLRAYYGTGIGTGIGTGNGNGNGNGNGTGNGNGNGNGIGTGTGTGTGNGNGIGIGNGTGNGNGNGTGTGEGTGRGRPLSSARRRRFGALAAGGKLEREVGAVLEALRAMPGAPGRLRDAGPGELAAVARRAAESFLQHYVECPAILSRCTWGARPYRGTPTPLALPLPWVFIHHTLVPASPCATFAACASAVRSVQSFHQDVRGWDDIGYSFVVGSDGYLYEGRGWHWVGAHTKGHNSRGFGLAFLGDFSRALPGADALRLVREELLPCAVRGGRLAPGYGLRGHRQLRPTACPGDALYREISTWQRFQP